MRKSANENKARRVMIRILIFAGVLATGLLAYMRIEAAVVHMVYAEVQLKDLPSAFDGLKILYVSDLHLTSAGDSIRAYRLMEQMCQLNPDILLLGGDYTSFSLGERMRRGFKLGGYDDLRAGERARRDQFFLMMRQVTPPLGKFAVAGNHDNETDALETSLTLGDVRLLRNQNVTLEKDGAKLFIAGLDDWGNGLRQIADVAGALNGKDCVILLSHNPDALPVVSNQPAADGLQWADLMLSGHTHGGQIRPFGWTALPVGEYAERYRSGWVRESGTDLLVSNGVGTLLLPLRWNAPAQAHLITLRAVP